MEVFNLHKEDMQNGDVSLHLLRWYKTPGREFMLINELPDCIAIKWMQLKGIQERPHDVKNKSKVDESGVGFY